MAISRPVLLVLLGVVLLGASAFAVSNARDTSDGSSVSSATTQQTSQQNGTQNGTLNADQALAAAFSGSGALDSGKIAASLDLNQAAANSQNLDFKLKLDGAFQNGAKNEMPLFAFKLKANTGGTTVTAGAVSVGDRAFLTQGNQAFRVPQALFTQFKQARRQIASFAPGSGATEPGILGLDPRSWLTNVKDEGEAQVDGVTTKHVSASVDAPKLVRDLLPLARQGGATVNLPSNLDEQIGKVVKKADVDIYVGQQDQILRRLGVALDLNLGQNSQFGQPRVRFDLNLTDVNKPQDITAPGKVSGGAPKAEAGAFSSALLGVGVLAVDPPPGLAAARKAGFRIGDVTSPAPITNNPRKVAAAVRRHQKVVILFRNPRGLDDQATSQSMHELRSQTKAKVFIDDIRSVDRFGPILEDVGVNQGPSIVIIDRRGNARLLEGFIDSRALAQEVADAR
jgi:hypothetical protein